MFRFACLLRFCALRSSWLLYHALQALLLVVNLLPAAPCFSACVRHGGSYTLIVAGGPPTGRQGKAGFGVLKELEGQGRKIQIVGRALRRDELGPKSAARRAAAAGFRQGCLFGGSAWLPGSEHLELVVSLRHAKKVWAALQRSTPAWLAAEHASMARPSWRRDPARAACHAAPPACPPAMHAVPLTRWAMTFTALPSGPSTWNCTCSSTWVGWGRETRGRRRFMGQEDASIRPYSRWALPQAGRAVLLPAGKRTAYMPAACRPAQPCPATSSPGQRSSPARPTPGRRGTLRVGLPAPAGWPRARAACRHGACSRAPAHFTGNV